MNQIEFIKKWAKHGDRIEDNGLTYLATIDEDGDFWFHNSQRRSTYGLNSNMQDSINWQSPKIYRLQKTGETLLVDKVIGYTETWELIADYADEVKKKEEKDVPLYDIVSNYIHQGKPIANVILKVTYEMDQRLKALEEKLK